MANPNKIVPRFKEDIVINCLQITLSFYLQYPGAGFKTKIAEEIVDVCRRQFNKQGQGRVVMKTNKQRTKIFIWLEINEKQSLFGESVYDRISKEFIYDQIEKAYMSFDFEIYKELNNIVKQTIELRNDGIYISGEEPKTEYRSDSSAEESKSNAKKNRSRNQSSESIRAILSDSSDSDFNISRRFGNTLLREKTSISSMYLLFPIFYKSLL